VPGSPSRAGCRHGRSGDGLRCHRPGRVCHVGGRSGRGPGHRDPAATPGDSTGPANRRTPRCGVLVRAVPISIRRCDTRPRTSSLRVRAPTTRKRQHSTSGRQVGAPCARHRSRRVCRTTAARDVCSVPQGERPLRAWPMLWVCDVLRVWLARLGVSPSCRAHTGPVAARMPFSDGIGWGRKAWFHWHWLKVQKPRARLARNPETTLQYRRYPRFAPGPVRRRLKRRPPGRCGGRPEWRQTAAGSRPFLP
jgi:hypothetical protein